MFHPTLRRAVVFVAPVPLLVAICAAWSPPIASRDEDATKLLQERRTVLQQVVELQRDAYRRGEAKVDFVLLAEMDLLEADLELAERPSHRIEIHERVTKAMQELENISHRRYEVGQASQADCLKAKAARLRAQADLILARAESKQSAERGAILIGAATRLTTTAPVLAVPERSVIDTGSKKIVYVEREPGRFEGVEVELGSRSGGFYLVIKGLKPGDRIAERVLIDAETRLNPAAHLPGSPRREK